MSSRQLRKLQKQKELEKLTPPEVAEESNEDEEPIATSGKPRASLFAALGGEDEEADEEHDQDEDDEHHEHERSPADDEESRATQSTPAKKNKKRKKKKKSKAAAPQEPIPEKEEAAENDEDEIDRAIKELNISTKRGDASEGGASQHEPSRRINELLKINTYHLKAIHEMTKLFGRDIIESANAEEEQEQHRRRRGPVQQQVDLETYLRAPSWAKKLPEVTLRRNVFIQGREHWPRQTTGGLSMQVVGPSPDGSGTEYTFAHDKAYEGAQIAFFAYVQMGDPMRMVYLLNEIPYHISTLLQVSNVAKQDQNMALSAELCERALFTFGRTATSAFRQDLENGRARLDFRRPENRQFWLAGYHYLKSLIRKGTYRTALEWAKLLYAMNLEDPYSMRHFIHFLAIRAHESRWLVDFLDELERTSVNRDLAYIRQTLVLAKLQMGDRDAARQSLALGMSQLPWLYSTLFQELNLDTPPSIWGISPETSSRKFWVKLYIHQAKDLWNIPEATALLQEVAKSLGKVDPASLPSDDAPPDLGATRLAFLEGQTGLLTEAPRELLERQPNYEFDPLPPAEEENIFTNDSIRLPWRGLAGPASASEQHNALEARLRNLMARQAARGGGAAAAGAAPGLAGMADADEDFDFEERAARDWEDEELQRDIEEHENNTAGGGQGMIARLINSMFGGGRGEEEEEEGDDNAAGHVGDGDAGNEAGGLPGAWPGNDDHGQARG